MKQAKVKIAIITKYGGPKIKITIIKNIADQDKNTSSKLK